jgi:hypothetical protein
MKVTKMWEKRERRRDRDNKREEKKTDSVRSFAIPRLCPRARALTRRKRTMLGGGVPRDMKVTKMWEKRERRRDRDNKREEKKRRRTLDDGLPEV